MIASTSQPLAMTMGDPAGIGPELALKAWLERAKIGAPFFVIADRRPLVALAERLGLDVPIIAVEPAGAAEVFEDALPVVPLAHEAAAEPGKPDPAFAPAILESIERAVRLVREGD